MEVNKSSWEQVLHETHYCPREPSPWVRVPWEAAFLQLSQEATFPDMAVSSACFQVLQLLLTGKQTRTPIPHFDLGSPLATPQQMHCVPLT